MSLTSVVYISLDVAFNYLNELLFFGELPDDCLITLQCKGGDGYFSPDKFKNRTDTTKAHEIGLNPDNFDGKSDLEILMVLAHQLCHFWEWEHCQANNLKKPARGYHSRRWANKMMRCGLMPSSTGEPKGKMTGSHVSQYIMKNGLFVQAYQRLLAEGFKLYWESKGEKQETNSKKSSKSRTKNKVKYTCSLCQQNAWAKPRTKLICGDCYDRWERVERMAPEHSDDGDWDED